MRSISFAMRSRPEETHQVVFEREEELRRARIALTAGAAAQLAVDAPRLVALGADDVQAADLHRPSTSLPSAILHRSTASTRVTPSPSLMSVPRPAMFVAIVIAPGWPALGDDLGLALVVLRVQHVVRDAPRA